MLRIRSTNWTLLVHIALVCACSGNKEGQTSRLLDATTSTPVDSGQDAGLLGVPDAFDSPDAANDDASQPDTGNGNLRTLPDYRVCETDEDCPIGLGGCIKTLPYNRAWPDGSTTATISELFESVSRGQGVCSAACTNEPSACSPLSFNGLTPDPKPYVCQLVALGPSPYPDANTLPLPFADQLDPAELVAGQPFASICRPPFELDPDVDDGFGSECQDTQTPCPGSSVCYDLLRAETATDGNFGLCLAPCNDGTCPQGFACDTALGLTSPACVPAISTQTDCLDVDRDGKGAGRCGPDDNNPVTELDCDDRNANAYYDQTTPDHPFPTFCGAHDYNCNGLGDDAEQVGSPDFGFAHCGSCNDTCTGTIAGFARRDCRVRPHFDRLTIVPGGCWPSCDDPTARADCNLDISDGCEVEVTDPTRVFWLDLDGDGFGDPNFSVFSCSSTSTPVGYAPSLAGEDCNDDEDSGSVDNPGAPELCDGRDNNCNGDIDESPFMDESAPCVVGGLLGACAQGQTICTNGTLECMRVNFPTAEVCSDDGSVVDEDCDGVDDNLTELCPNQTGACAGAVRRCGALAFSPRFRFGSGCSFPRVPGGPPQPNSYDLNNEAWGVEICNDGIDNDCDGDTDCADSRCTNNPFCNDFCPTLGLQRSCPNQNGVCGGSMQTCENRAGTTRWSVCNYGAFSTDYRSSELGEFDCSDGLDNDCAGGADCDDIQCANTDWCANFCPTNGATRACPLTRGVCLGARQTCIGNQWSACDESFYLSHDPDYRQTENSSHCDGMDNDCDGTTDEGCPRVGTSGFTISTSRRHRLEVTYQNGDSSTQFGGGTGPSYNLFCPSNRAMTKLHVYHNNHTARNYSYRNAMRIIRVGITCGRPEVRLSGGNYEARMQNSEVRYPTSSNRVSDSSSNSPRGPSYPFSSSGNYVGTWGVRRDAWAVFSDEFQHSTVNCGVTGVIRGAKIKAGGWIDAMGATCHNVTISPPSSTPLMFTAEVRTPEEYWGGVDASSRETNAECPAGEVMVGVRVQMENNNSSTTNPNREWVSEISFYCAPLQLNTIQ